MNHNTRRTPSDASELLQVGKDAMLLNECMAAGSFKSQYPSHGEEYTEYGDLACCLCCLFVKPSGREFICAVLDVLSPPLTRLLGRVLSLAIALILWVIHLVERELALVNNFFCAYRVILWSVARSYVVTQSWLILGS